MHSAKWGDCGAGARAVCRSGPRPIHGKKAMFFYTNTSHAPWTVIKSNDNKRGRLKALRHVLDCADKKFALVGPPDPLIVRPATDFLEPDTQVRPTYPVL